MKTAASSYIGISYFSDYICLPEYLGTEAKLCNLKQAKEIALLLQNNIMKLVATT